MSGPTQPEPEKKRRTVHCRRLDQPLSADEHAQCSYCHGRKADIDAGVHEHFCGYDPDKDPINFGFPPDNERTERG